jgi:FXSXX-COOH protein
MTTAAVVDDEPYDSGLIDLGAVSLDDLVGLDHPALERSLLRVLDATDRPGTACAGFQSAL